MKKNLLFTFVLLASGLTGFATTFTVTNNGNFFTPAVSSINVGDDIMFDIESSHQAREVSAETWNNNGNTILPGGFQTPYGGGAVTAGQLTAGTHYYVCTDHASMGMKGLIFVGNGNPNAISENTPEAILSAFPNPAENSISIKAGNDMFGSNYIVTDMLGKQVLNGRIYSNLTVIDITELVSGMYLFQVADHNNQTIRVQKK